MKDLQHKDIKLEIKIDAEARSIEGYGAVFGNVDSWGDIILPGAFAETVKTRKPKMLYQHNSSKIIGRWDSYTEDTKGLYVRGTFAKTANAEEAYELAKMGELDGLSIGYSPTEFEYNGKGIRELKKVDLWEVSLVTFPANPEATVTGVKTTPESITEFEKFLRDAGYSRTAAKTIAARGFKALSGQRDVEATELLEVSELLNKATNILKGSHHGIDGN